MRADQLRSLAKLHAADGIERLREGLMIITHNTST